LKVGDFMTVIAQDVFTLAMKLMDEESLDGTFNGYSIEYRNKAWSILTMLQTEILPPDILPLAITNESNVLQIDDRLSLTALPYGLASHLLLNEDENKAAFFNARYDELKRKTFPTTNTVIEQVYGINTITDTGEQSNDEVYEGGSFLDSDSGVYDGGEF
jgi:hypothetical protein